MYGRGKVFGSEMPPPPLESCLACSGHAFPGNTSCAQMQHLNTTHSSSAFSIWVDVDHNVVAWRVTKCLRTRKWAVKRQCCQPSRPLLITNTRFIFLQLRYDRIRRDSGVSCNSHQLHVSRFGDGCIRTQLAWACSLEHALGRIPYAGQNMSVNLN